MPPLRLRPPSGARPGHILRASRLDHVSRLPFATQRSARPPSRISPSSRSRPSRDSRYARPRRAHAPPKSTQQEPEKKIGLSDALRDTKDEDNSLLSPVHIPEDPNGVLNEKHPAATILANSGIVIQRQLELMNVMIGFEQANKYIILDPQGNHVGFIAEQDNSMGRTMARQLFSTHRSFTTHVFDKHEKEILRVCIAIRSFSTSFQGCG